MTLRAERAEHERNEFKKPHLVVTYELDGSLHREPVRLRHVHAGAALEEQKVTRHADEVLQRLQVDVARNRLPGRGLLGPGFWQVEAPWTGSSAREMSPVRRSHR